MKNLVIILIASFSFLFSGYKVPDIDENGNYVVHGDFKNLLKDPSKKCYDFKVSSEAKHHECDYCKTYYVSQKFTDKEGMTHTLYSNSECNNSSTKYHDNLELEPLGDCPCLTIVK